MKSDEYNFEKNNKRNKNIPEPEENLEDFRNWLRKNK